MKTLDFTGLDEKKVQPVVNGLGTLLADLQVFYTNLRAFHWNVKGHAFFTLHAKFEEIYDDVAEKVDEVAERILQLGAVPESRYSVYLTVSEVTEAPHVECGKEIVAAIRETLKVLIARERQIVADASEAGDDVTVALMDDYLKGQEKLVWMLVAVGE